MDASRLAKLWTLSMTTPVTGVTASSAPSTSRAGDPSLANRLIRGSNNVQV